VPQFQQLSLPYTPYTVPPTVFRGRRVEQAEEPIRHIFFFYFFFFFFLYNIINNLDPTPNLFISALAFDWQANCPKAVQKNTCPNKQALFKAKLLKTKGKKGKKMP
jgi:hypothetical protein